MRRDEFIEYSARCYMAAKGKGFWDAPRNVGEMFMLIIGECSEALEAHRKGLFTNKDVSGKAISQEDFAILVKDTFEDEMADIVIRMFDALGYAYSISREDVSVEVSSALLNAPVRPLTLSLSVVYDRPACVGAFLLKVVNELCYVSNDYTLSNFSPALPCFKHMIVVLGKMVWFVWDICKDRGIDLTWHIEAKLAYNATREHKHGKRY